MDVPEMNGRAGRDRGRIGRDAQYAVKIAEWMGYSIAARLPDGEDVDGVGKVLSEKTAKA